MTNEEALQEAQRLWGKTGSIFDRIEDAEPLNREYMNESMKRVGRYWVGKNNFGETYGNGDTWEAAFANAARDKE